MQLRSVLPSLRVVIAVVSRGIRVACLSLADIRTGIFVVANAKGMGYVPPSDLSVINA